MNDYEVTPEEAEAAKANQEPPYLNYHIRYGCQIVL